MTVFERVRVARFVPTFVYIPSSAPAPGPGLQADIHMRKAPFEPAPPKLFAAASLKAALEDYVKSEKCGMGNVCPHVHEYLLPKGTLRPR
jgi:hypothetical protein